MRGLLRFRGQAATRDPDDDYLVALARQHRADFIVTGDKDLLEWDDQVPPAITPAAFEDLLSAREHPKRNPSEPAIVIDDGPARFAT